MRKLVPALLFLSVVVALSASAQAQVENSETANRINDGEKLAAEGSWSDAQAEFLRATQLDNNNLVGFYDLGVAQVHLNQFDHAIASEREALRINQNYVPAYIELGLALSQANDAQGAVEAEQQALKLDPDNQVAQKNLAIIQQEHHLTPLKVFINVKEAVVPAPDQNQALAENMSVKKAYEKVDLAWSLAKNGKWREAKIAYENAFSLDSQLVIAKTGIAICDAKLGRYQQAKAVLRDAKVLFPHSAWPHLGLAIVFGKQHKNSEASAELDQALALEPNNLEALRQKAALLLEQKNWTAAASAYKALLDKSTADAEDHIGLGLALSGTNDNQAAISEFKQAVALEPDNASAQKTLELAQAPPKQDHQQLAQSAHRKFSDQVR